jgi:hypothetical protein
VTRRKRYLRRHFSPIVEEVPHAVVEDGLVYELVPGTVKRISEATAAFRRKRMESGWSAWREDDCRAGHVAEYVHESEEEDEKEG